MSGRLQDENGKSAESPGSVTDANEEIPPLPPKKYANEIPTLPPEIFTGRRIPSAGSLLMMANSPTTKDKEFCGDQEIFIHQVLKTPLLQEPSESTKAFFESTDIPSFQYDMSHKHRGYFVIFNHEHYSPLLRLNPRKGTSVDARDLKQTAKMLGFESDHIKVYHDLKAKDFFQKINKFSSKKDHTDCDCFVMAILTHGEKNDVIYLKDDKIFLDDVIESFMARQCPSLAGKPKLFFIQACRGRQYDEGLVINCGGDTVDAKAVHNTEESEKDYMTICNAADFLLAYSTVPGYYAWRDKISGSWFIQALCRCLQEFGHNMEIMQIMTRVNRMVAYDYKANWDNSVKKQIPHIVTRLTSEVMFHRKQKKKAPFWSKKRRKRKKRKEVSLVDGETLSCSDSSSNSTDGSDESYGEEEVERAEEEAMKETEI